MNNVMPPNFQLMRSYKARCPICKKYSCSSYDRYNRDVLHWHCENALIVAQYRIRRWIKRRRVIIKESVQDEIKIMKVDPIVSIINSYL